MSTPHKNGIDLDRLLAPDAKRTPAMQAVRDWLNAESAGLPHWRTMPAAEGRAQSARMNQRWVENLPSVASVTPVTVPATDKTPDVVAEIIEPHEAAPGCIVFFHGGGWAFSDPALHQGFSRRLAIAARTRVLSVDYRLAPENPFPAPLDDCVAAWRWLFDQSTQHAALRGALAVAGDSAGANLALGLILHEMREARPLPDAGLLFYGAYTADPDTRSSLRFAEGFGLARADMMQFWDWYATPEQRRDPLVCPILAGDADLARLPPLFLNAAGLDPLLSDTIDFFARLEPLQAPHECVVHEGVEHGFMRMSEKLPVADEAIALAAAFFRDRTAHFSL